MSDLWYMVRREKYFDGTDCYRLYFMCRDNELGCDATAYTASAVKRAQFFKDLPVVEV
jgi:hypothetical protein